MTNEVALLEQSKIGLEPLDQLVDGAGPERASDHRSRLERRLLGRFQKVDTGCQDRAHRIGYDELVDELMRGPITVLPLEHADVDQRPNELLDEERVAVCALDHDFAQAGRQLGRNEVVEHPSGVRGREDLQPDRLAVATAAAQRGPAAGELRPPGSQQ